MAVEKAERTVRTLIDNVSSDEIRLPEIQRGYVWKPPQVARLVESLYRGYPSGSLLFWRTGETPQTRDVAASAPRAEQGGDDGYGTAALGRRMGAGPAALPRLQL